MMNTLSILILTQVPAFVEPTRELAIAMLFNPDADVRRLIRSENFIEQIVGAGKSTVVTHSVVNGSYNRLSGQLFGMTLVARSPVCATLLTNAELKARFLLVASKLPNMDIIVESFRSRFDRTKADYVGCSFDHKAGAYKFGSYVNMRVDWRTGDVIRISIGRLPQVANPNVTAIPTSVAVTKARQFLAEKFPTKTFELAQSGEPMWSECPMDFHQFLIDHPEYRSMMWLPSPDVAMADRQRYLTPAADLVIAFTFRSTDDSLKLVVTCDGLDGHVIVAGLENDGRESSETSSDGLS